MKATAKAPANIAFIKYWGMTDPDLILPANSSISMNLSDCFTITTVEFSKDHLADTIFLESSSGEKETVEGRGKAMVINHLNRLRDLANVSFHAKVVTQNSFPTSIGIASSASGFAALTLAVVTALELEVDKKELSILTRLSGSGSACRSILDGFVRWNKGTSSETSYAEKLASPDWWDLLDIIVIFDKEKKKISSQEGHTVAKTSPHYQDRLKELPERIQEVEEAIINRDISQLGEAIEEEAESLHLITTTSTPPIEYRSEKTKELCKAIKEWRIQGIQAYYTIDAGSAVHIICEGKEKEKVMEKVERFEGVAQTIINKPTVGARVVAEHLFL